MNEITARAFFDELSKIADVVHPMPGGGAHIDPNELADPNDPNDPITRYQSMQRRKPILRDVLREGAVGAVAAPALWTAKEMLGKGVKDTFKLPQSGGHFAAGGFGRKALATGAIGALAAGAMPLLRSQLALKAEEENVKQQLGIAPDTGVRSAVRRTVGVG